MTQPFDPLARYVDKETGLEYENFGSFFAGEEQNTERNKAISHVRKLRYPPHAIKAFWEGYDNCPPTTRFLHVPGEAELQETSVPAPHRARYEAGVACGKATGCWGSTGSAQTSFGILSPKAAAAWSQALFDAAKQSGSFGRLVGNGRLIP